MLIVKLPLRLLRLCAAAAAVVIKHDRKKRKKENQIKYANLWTFFLGFLYSFWVNTKMTGQKYNQRYYIDSTITRAVHFFVFFFFLLGKSFWTEFLYLVKNEKEMDVVNFLFGRGLSLPSSSQGVLSINISHTQHLFAFFLISH